MIYSHFWKFPDFLKGMFPKCKKKKVLTVEQRLLSRSITEITNTEYYWREKGHFCLLYFS